MENDATGFWTMIGATIVAGIAYMLGAKKLIAWLTRLITGGERK
jgi:hypothetical protein